MSSILSPIPERTILRRVYAPANKWTFRIPPIRRLLREYDMSGWVDPFSGKYSPAEITNDIEWKEAKYHIDGLLFLKGLPDTCLSGGTAGRLEYQSACKDEIARIIKPGGYAICFGWDSIGLGKGRRFTLMEVLLVCHGAAHRDTIVTIERRMNGVLA
jgi:hypothetical protein